MKCDEINIVQTGKSVYISMRTEDIANARQAYDTHQMSLLIDRLIAECKDLGIETLSPDELERMMEEYEKQANKSTCNPAGG